MSYFAVYIPYYKIGEYRREITSSRTFAIMLYGCIRKNPAKFFNMLFDFNIVGSVIILAKNAKQNWDQMKEKVQALHQLSAR